MLSINLLMLAKVSDFMHMYRNYFPSTAKSSWQGVYVWAPGGGQPAAGERGRGEA